MKKLCGLGLSAIVPNNGGIGAETKLSMRHQELSCSLPFWDAVGMAGVWGIASALSV